MKKINTNKLLLRVLTLPFFGIIAFITMFYNYSIWVCKWLLYGGEIVLKEDKEKL